MGALELSAKATPGLRPQPGASPYGAYDRLRALDEKLWHQRPRWRGLVRYDDVRDALRDPRLSSAGTSRTFRRFLFAQLPAEGRESFTTLADVHQSMMVYSDGEQHRRLRDVVQPGMAPHAVGQLRMEIERSVDHLLGRIASLGRADLIGDLAVQVPMHATAVLLGLPEVDEPRFLRWSEAAFSLSGTNGGIRTNALAATRLLREIVPYLNAVSRWRATEIDRTPNLLDAILSAGCLTELDKGCGHEDVAVAATFVSILAGGFETATNLIGNGLLALLLHPEQLARLRNSDDQTLVEIAIEELARYDSPVQMTARTAMEPVEIGGKRIERGEVVECWIGAANRDPDAFTNPDSLDIGRTEKRHLAFGHGAHFCVGAALARLEAQIAIPAVLRRLPELRLGVDPDALSWKPIVTFRALEALPVRFRAVRI